jgi:hypothetical protein
VSLPTNRLTGVSHAAIVGRMQRKRSPTLPRVLAVLGLGAVAWLALAGQAGRAEGGPMDDGVPAGTIAFVSGGACPAGWTTATVVQGRLVVGVADGTKGGVQVGAPLSDQEDRQHQHTYTASVPLPTTDVSGSDGSNDNGASAQTYTVTGSTDMAPTSLPFVQVQPCLKQ